MSTTKQGWQTSEFWLNLAALIVPSVGASLGGSGDPMLLAIGAALTGLYTLTRSVVKVFHDVKTAAELNAAPRIIQTPAGPVQAPVPGQPIVMTVTYETPTADVVPPSVAQAASAPRL